jgi:hypothetical protein
LPGRAESRRATRNIAGCEQINVRHSERRMTE